MNILRYSVENFRCFREKAEVSFVASNRVRQPHSSRTIAGLEILPVVGVYGANASGKTTLIDGLIHIRDHIRHSVSLKPGAKIPWSPWRLDRGETAPPTEMTIDFELDGARFQYGFVYNAERFLQEWLYRWQSTRRQVLFERDEDGDEEWYFGAMLNGEKKAIAKSTKSNSLFLSTAAHMNHELLSSVFRALIGGIAVEGHIELHGHPVFVEGAPILSPERRDAVERVVKAFDLGCSGIRVEQIQHAVISDALKELLRPEALDELGGRDEKKRYRIVLERTAEDGSVWVLPSEEESRGTNVLLARLNDLLIQEGGVLIIDELNTSLHSDMCVELVRFFTEQVDGTESYSQLLFSTHDQSLMSGLRRDEVVLVEREADGSARATPVTDFRGVRGRDQLQELYSSGRIGGLPILGNVSQLLAEL